MWNNKNWQQRIKLLGLLLGLTTSAQAEVLLILPESGPMARAALGIQQGFMAAYQASGQKTDIKVVNSAGQKMSNLLQKHVHKNTQWIVGPLARQDVDALMQAKPKVPVLSLNEVNRTAANIWQFSLAKNQDAAALKRLLIKDKINTLWVLYEQGTEAEHELFFMALMSQLEQPVQIVSEIPNKLSKKQGLLLLGSQDWMMHLANVPNKRVYTVANRIETPLQLPQGIQFCDVPALYQTQQISEVAAESLAYQRLYAFGQDAWQMTALYLQQHTLEGANFAGQSGLIQIENGQIGRLPSCFQRSRKAIVPIRIS